MNSFMGGPSSGMGAPTIDQSGASRWLSDQDQASQQAQLQAQQLAYRTATGQGPSLAAAQAQQQAQQAMSNQNAMASSSGGSSLAAARRQAMMSNANTMGTLGGNAATARAQEELGAQQNLGQFAAQGRQGDIASANTMAGMATSQGQLQESQNQSNQQAAAANQSANMQLIGGAAGAMGGLLMADADLKEPGGGAWETMREEQARGGHPGWILVEDHQTGRLGKVHIDPLTPAEHAQARGAHGAGALASAHRVRTTFHDMAMGGAATGDAAAWDNPANQRALAELDWGQGAGGMRPVTAMDQYRAQDPYGAPAMQPNAAPPPTSPLAQSRAQHPATAQRAGAAAAMAPQQSHGGLGMALSNFGSAVSGVPMAQPRQQPVAYSPWAQQPIQAADLDMGMSGLRRRYADLDIQGTNASGRVNPDEGKQYAAPGYNIVGPGPKPGMRTREDVYQTSKVAPHEKRRAAG